MACFDLRNFRVGVPEIKNASAANKRLVWTDEVWYNSRAVWLFLSRKMKKFGLLLVLFLFSAGSSVGAVGGGAPGVDAVEQLRLLTGSHNRLANDQNRLANDQHQLDIDFRRVAADQHQLGVELAETRIQLDDTQTQLIAEVRRLTVDLRQLAADQDLLNTGLRQLANDQDLLNTGLRQLAIDQRRQGVIIWRVCVVLCVGPSLFWLLSCCF